CRGKRKRDRPFRAGPAGWSGDDRKEQERGPSGGAAADDRTDDRDPRVGPVAAALALDGEEGMCDARTEVTGRVDRIAGGTTERHADADHEEGHGQRAEGGEAGGVALTPEADDH